VEVAKNFWRERVVPLWVAFANALCAFVEEAAFRTGLAFDVMVGKLPRKAERRFWNRSTETPVLADVYDWTDDRLIFSVLVWPSLDPNHRFALEAERAHRQRVEEVLAAIAKGAKEKMWSTRWEVDWGLEWDHERGAWVSPDGHAYDGERLTTYSRTCSRNGTA
jgi:hypothetical protein